VSGTGTPEECVASGSRIEVYGSTDTLANASYTFKVLKEKITPATGDAYGIGGWVDSIERDGVEIDSIPGTTDMGKTETTNKALDAVSGATTVTVKAGDQIEINADTEDEEHNAFQYWKVVIGDLTMTYKTVRTQTITMPQGDVILQPVYTDDSTEQVEVDIPDGYTPTSADDVVTDEYGNRKIKNGFVTLDYSPQDGKFALDPYKLDDARDLLYQNAEDMDILDDFVLASDGSLLRPAKREIKYTIKLDYHTPTVSVASLTSDSNQATPSNAAWQLDINLTRAVDGVSTPLVSEDSYENYGGDPKPQIKFYGILENTDLNNANYQLWRLNDDGTFEKIEVDAFKEENADEFTGAFSFYASVGDTLILTYEEVFTVTVRDSLVRGFPEFVLTVPDGADLYESLDNAADEEGILDYIRQDYTDDSGVEYMYLGLAKRDSTHILEAGYQVTQNIILVALYEESSAWKEVHDALAEAINNGKSVVDNPLASAKQIEALQEALDEAVALYNALAPKATIEDMQAAIEKLVAATDEARKGDPSVTGDYSDYYGDDKDHWNGSGNFTDQEGKKDNGDTTTPTGTTSYSGSGGGGGSIHYSNEYLCYEVGEDGDWVQSADGKWYFHLNSGANVSNKWVNIREEINGVVVTYTYHFNADGTMTTGWYVDASGTWYYLSEKHDGAYGHMVTGWYWDTPTQKWYYLDSIDGSMVEGWEKVGYKWYYLTPKSTTPVAGHPEGSMYINETTPDGYVVDENGGWEKETP
jgi:glucan-binding YG repeat protein